MQSVNRWPGHIPVWQACFHKTEKEVLWSPAADGWDSSAATRALRDGQIGRWGARFLKRNHHTHKHTPEIRSSTAKIDRHVYTHIRPPPWSIHTLTYTLPRHTHPLVQMGEMSVIAVTLMLTPHRLNLRNRLQQQVSWFKPDMLCLQSIFKGFSFSFCCYNKGNVS